MAQEGFKRRLSAILSADVKGYSRMMRDDGDATIRTMTTSLNAILIRITTRPIQFKHFQLDDAKKVKRIGTLRDDTRERLLKRHGFTNLEPVSDEQLNAKKLALGRIDLWTYKIPGLRTVCDLAGVDYTEFEEVYHLRKIDLMIAFSKMTSDSIVQKWRNAFNEMLADETIMRIRTKWNLKLEDDPFPEIEDK